jgi:23S rRNA (cytosine1962-C5)-methyltransferase
MSAIARIVLKTRRARPFFARHPWVFDTSIDRIEGSAAPGDEVRVVTADGETVALGLYNPASTIRVRLYRWEEGPLDLAFWSGRIAKALRLRLEILRLVSPGSACRLIFSEGDGLSGLTVDRYDRWLVVQFTSLALYLRREMILRLLAEQTGALGILARTERGIAPREGLKPGEDTVQGALPERPIEIVEHGLTYRVDVGQGQKTGFYLDQRDNRRAVASYAAGRRVLDLFCYSGAYSLTALRHGGASEALGIDSSPAAIELARQHAVNNGIDGAVFETGDALAVIDRLRQEGRIFDMVICDPPKFARQAKDIDRALKGYNRLNLAALSVLAPDGMLATCSCSGLLGREAFADLIGHAAEQSHRPIQILESRGQAPDHPVSASCLETDYLKCLICRVE